MGGSAVNHPTLGQRHLLVGLSYGWPRDHEKACYLRLLARVCSALAALCRSFAVAAAMTHWGWTAASRSEMSAYASCSHTSLPAHVTVQSGEQKVTFQEVSSMSVSERAERNDKFRRVLTSFNEKSQVSDIFQQALIRKRAL